MLGIALIGCGYWGKNVGKSLLKSKMFDLKCICDENDGALEDAKVFFGRNIDYETDYKKAILRRDIDCVAIATQTESHFEIAKEALERGRHVYVEKPATLNSAEAERLHKARNGLVIHVDHIMVYSPSILKAKELIDNGEIGDILHIDCSRVNLGIARKDVNVMWDLSIHDLSIVDFFLGGEVPREVFAVGTKGSFCQETTTALSLRYKNAIATIRASWLSPVKERKITVYGSKKTMIINDMEQIDKIVLYNKRIASDGTREISGDSTIMAIEIEEPLINSLEHFGECIQEKKESTTNAKSAVRLLKILEMADKQIRK